MSERTRHVEKINAARKELETAGTIHRRDLLKHIHRMEKQLLIYDKHHRKRQE